MKNNLLYIKNPELLKKIHPTKNEGVDLFKLTCSSRKKIWWICDKNHDFDDDVNNRNKGNGCPFCSGKRVCVTNCLATIHPTLSLEWDVLKNENLTPFDVTCSSNKKVWWKCELGHEWEAKISKRTRGTNCPYCSGNKVCIDNCLATLNPALSSEWNINKNENLTPFDFTVGSKKKVWWKCELGHEWEAKIVDRGRGNNCGICNNNGTSDIERRFYYYLQLVFNNTINGHKIKNDNKRDVEVDIFIPEINLAIEYDGVYFHKKEENINRDILKNDFLKEKQINLIRIREFGLLSIHDVEFIYDYKNKKSFKNTLINILNYVSKNFLLNRAQKLKTEEVIKMDVENHIIPKGFFVYPLKKDSLLIKNPELAKQWHPTKNGDLKPEHVACGSDKKVWWICKNKHEWKAQINPRNNGRGCPYCSGYKVCLDNCLATLKPELSKQWHPTKNGFLTPFDVVCWSNKKIWWKCDVEEDHEWEAVISSRTSGNNCPCCSGYKIVSSNCLATTHSELSKQWHPTKNGDLTPFNVTAGSNKKVWWECVCGHEWNAKVRTRNNGYRNCEKCIK